jgi:hypothetical protein
MMEECKMVDVIVPDTTALLNSVITSLTTTISAMIPLLVMVCIVIVCIWAFKKYAKPKVTGR